MARVGVDDNFFSLGGDSIRTILLVSRARRRGLELTLRDVFQYPTAEALALVARLPETAPAPKTSPAPFSLLPDDVDRNQFPTSVEDAYPLAMIQAGMLFHILDSPQLGLYHNVMHDDFESDQPFDLAAFQAAVDRSVARHGLLRTSFDLHTHSQPLQLVHRTAQLTVRYSDLRSLSNAEQYAVLADCYKEEMEHAYDLTAPPLLRFRIHHLSDIRFRVITTECHAVMDGWSFYSLLVEIFNSYSALVTHSDPGPADHPSASYRDFIANERRLLETSDYKEFWRRKLAGRNTSTIRAWPRAPTQRGDATVPVGLLADGRVVICSDSRSCAGVRCR